MQSGNLIITYHVRMFVGLSIFSGSLTNAIAETGRVDRLSFGEASPSDLDIMVDKIVAYSAAAILHMGDIKTTQQ